MDLTFSNVPWGPYPTNFYNFGVHLGFWQNLILQVTPKLQQIWQTYSLLHIWLLSGNFDIFGTISILTSLMTSWNFDFSDNDLVHDQCKNLLEILSPTTQNYSEIWLLWQLNNYSEIWLLEQTRNYTGYLWQILLTFEIIHNFSTSDKLW